MPHDVFISYSTKDKPLADAVCARLEGRGIRCWIAPRDIIPGADWGGSIVEAINESRVFVLIFTSNYNASQQTGHEVERAVNKGLHIIPLRVEDVPPTPSLEYFMGKRHWLDAITPPVESHLDKLGDAIERVLGVTPQPPTTASAPAPSARTAPSKSPTPRAATQAEIADLRRKRLLLIGAAVALLALVAIIAISAGGGGKAPSEAVRVPAPKEAARKPEAPPIDLGPDPRIGAAASESIARSRALIGNRTLPGDAAGRLHALDNRWREVERLAWSAENTGRIRAETDSIAQAAAALEASLPGAVEAYERAALARRVGALRASLDEAAQPFDLPDEAHDASLQSLRERLAELERREVLVDRLDRIEADAARIETSVHAWATDARTRLERERIAIERPLALAARDASETSRILFIELTFRQDAWPIKRRLESLEQRIAQVSTSARTVSALRRAAAHAATLAEEARLLRAEAEALLPVTEVNELLEEAKAWIGRSIHLLSHRETAADPGLRIVERAEARPIRAEENNLVLSLANLGRDSPREVRWRIRDDALAGPVARDREATLRRIAAFPAGIAWAGLDRIDGALLFASDDSSALALVLPTEVTLLASTAGRHHSEWRTIGGALPFDALWFEASGLLTLDVAALCAGGPMRLRGVICLPDDVPVADSARCQVRAQADSAQVWTGELSARERRVEIDAVVRRGSRSLTLGLAINPGVAWNFAVLGLRFEPAQTETSTPAAPPREPAAAPDTWTARVDAWAGRTLLALQLRDEQRMSTVSHWQFGERQENSVPVKTLGTALPAATAEIRPDGLAVPVRNQRSTNQTTVLFKPVPNLGNLSFWPHGDPRVYEGAASDGRYFIIEPPRGAVPASSLLARSSPPLGLPTGDGGKSLADPLSISGAREISIPVRVLTAERSWRLRGAAHVTTAGGRAGRARLVVLVDGQERQSYSLDGADRIDVNAPIARNAGVVVIRQEGFGPGVVLNCIWLTPN